MTNGKRWSIPAWDLYIAGALLLTVAAVYSPVRHYGFVDYDDYAYVTNNDHVLSGLNAESLRWALTSTEFGNWFPLTWISLMADRQFFASPEEAPPLDIRAGAHHLTNVMLHAAGTLLLFALLKRMTGASGPSALVAFLFALHPLHVESVAWVSERKDVLSGVFWMLALWCYVRYASRPKAATYLLTLLLYCLGFLAKPMVVTLPLVLVLLDFWPLRRLTIPPVRGLWMRLLIREKFPFYLLALAMAAATYVVQKQGGAVRTLAEVSWSGRLENAVVSAAVYIGQLLWPTRLAVLYPLPASQPVSYVLLAGLMLAAITAVALRSVRTRPYLAVGWFWYLVTVLPVIGIVQVGLQVRADRYMYIPSIGLLLMLVWTGADVWRRWPAARLALGCLCCAACVACVAMTWRQLGYWQDSVALFQHTLEVTGPNAFAHGYLGQVWEEQVMYEEAISEYRKGLEIVPHNVALLSNLGNVLTRFGRTAEAIAPLSEAVRLQPRDALIRNALGAALAVQGRMREAQSQLEEAIRLKPDFSAAHDSLGFVWQHSGRLDDAIAEFSEAVRLQPRNGAAQQDLQKALAIKEHVH